jgi:hypothetical protein
MAKKRKNQSNVTSSVEVNAFVKGMIKDYFPSYQPKQNWTHARNAANNSVDGDAGVLGNEPANLPCADVPYTIIGAIHTYADQWVIYSTNDTDSEIGLFDDSKCEYKTLVNDRCLQFQREHLIVGAAKENFDCSWQVYWDDGNNPSRTLNLDNIPYVQVEVSTPGADCVIYEDTPTLDCEKLRLAPLLDTPCIDLSKATDGGQLRNGTYQAFIAYTVNEQRITDYIGISNLQSLFDHENTAGSLDLAISNLDKEFDFFELVILSNNQNNYVAKRIGLYSTETTNISIDFIDPALPSIALELLPLRNPAYEKSDSMYVVNDYLIRQGPTEQFDFNYQPRANQIKTEWVVAEYESTYYYKGGNKTNFMRDEQYAFFIRWIYNTGERSNSYHIPGRAPRFDGQNQFGDVVDETQVATDINSLSNSEMNFQVFNTATVTQNNINTSLPDGGVIKAIGDMAYWESTERYPATKPEIWNATHVDDNGVNIGDCFDTNFDLCGKFIRHHKMPTEEVDSILQTSNPSGDRIRILGVQFSNIKRPVYNDGTPIMNIVGYELLRGSREGAKSILGKGIFRNMRKYDIPNQTGNLQGLYPNFPYNDLGPDQYHHYVDTDLTTNPNYVEDIQTTGDDSFTNSKLKYPPLTGYAKDVFTFHSPELMFKRPFLNAYETRIYGTKHGESEGQFIKSEKHPQNKLLRNSAALVASIFGAGYALEKIRGRKKKKYTPKRSLAVDQFGAFGVGSGTIQAPFWGPNTGGSVATTAVQAGLQVAMDYIINELLLDSAYAVGDMATGGAVSALGIDIQQAIGDVAMALVPGTKDGAWTYDIDGSELKETPTLALLFTGLMNFAQQFSVGTNEMIEMMYNLVSARDFALKYNSHGFYSDFINNANGTRWRAINDDSNYVGSVFQNFGATGQYKINNLFRPKTIAINTNIELDNPTVADNSRIVIGDLSNNLLYKNYEVTLTRTISAKYGALKYSFENQYGQLDQIKQVPMRGCINIINPQDSPMTLYSTDPMFTGDTYIGRYSEKTIMPIFTDFLYGQPEQYPFDYLKRINIPYPRYWMDTRKFDVTKAVAKITSFDWNDLNLAFPSGLFYLDRRTDSLAQSDTDLLAEAGEGNMPLFSMANAYMYVHCNGIQDFFVESEVNLAQRDWEDQRRKRHYDIFEYTNVDDLFDAEHIKEDNFYRYDYSLSASRFITNLTSFGNIQTRDYDPEVAEECYTYYKKRLIYSLQAQRESKKDFWRVYLPNNYKDFKNAVTTIKPISKNGAIIFFPYQSPQMFQGVDTLKTDGGTKITIGDGGLFSQPFQNIVNSDMANEYGSVESQRTVINTPMGVYFISQAQGKVFEYTGKGLNNIANNGMKWWFNKYLPSQLLKQVPELEDTPLADNPVIGIGCQAIYDINDDIAYFCKKDYRIKPEFENDVIYTPGVGFEYILPGLGTPIAQDPVINEPEPNIVAGPKTLFTWVCDPATGACTYQMGNAGYLTEAECLQNCGTPPPPSTTWFCEDGVCVKKDDTSGYATREECEANCITPPPPPPPPISVRIPITLGDPFYFEDVSWTVSYDPKSKAWISFHDWHPELCLASINHFLTTKTTASEEPYCPPGFSFNPSTGNCERGGVESAPAVVSIDEIPAIIEGGLEDCLIDLVIACDTSGSTNSDPDIRIAEQEFITNFVNNAGVQQGMSSQRIQLGFTSWSNSMQQISMNPNGFSMSNTVTEQQVTTWYNANWYGGGTGMAPGLTHAVGVLNDVASSELGDRSSDPNYRKIVVFITDSGGSPGSNFGCQYQSPIASPSGTGPNDQFIYAVYAGPQNTPPNQNAFNDITCTAGPANVDPYQYGVSTGMSSQEVGVVADALVGQVCGGPPSCSCPPGYTLVYPGANGGFTEPTGECVTGGGDLIPPICRQIECNCPPSTIQGSAQPVITGQCDDIYLGGPNGQVGYQNPDPQICTYNTLESVEPSYTKGGIWRHNYRCDLYANYYGVDYPWEVEIVESSGQNVNTVRSMEYQLESFVYKGDLFNGCSDDRWHDLNFNFDEAIIYNSEQVSGLLKLNLSPSFSEASNPYDSLQFPIIGLNSIDILYTKEEQKYRFNQFWDVTADRGEFGINPVQNQIFETQNNGYIRDLNFVNLNYEKEEEQRKKFRHYYNKVILRRVLSEDRKMLLKLNNTKLNLSMR